MCGELVQPRKQRVRARVCALLQGALDVGGEQLDEGARKKHRHAKLLCGCLQSGGHIHMRAQI